MKQNRDLSTLLKELHIQIDVLKNIEKEISKLNKPNISLPKSDEKHTVSFQLGSILINSTKSFNDFISTPNKLFKLYQVNKERKKAKITTATAKPKEPIEIKVSKKQNTIAKFTKGLTLLDPISELCWSDAFTGFPIVRKDFQKQIKSTTSQFAFFESAWRANKGSWLYAFTSPGLKHDNAQALLTAISLLKKKKIPIIFWNKEDPMHYEMFKPITKYADYIFTTDSLIVDKYKKELGNNNVWAVPFAAPVKQTNPIGRFALKTETVCFAGTYYAKNHENRKKQMDMLLPALLENNGVIYDRASKEQKEEYAYPKIYDSIIRNAVNFNEMISLYKKFKVFLNVNTITQSTTMMSRRVYELLASGTPVVSTTSKAITEQFPGIVITVNNEQEAKLAVHKLLTDSYYWHKQSVLGIREIMHSHTYEKRWDYINSVINSSEQVNSHQLNVRVIAQYHGYIDLSIYINSLINQNNIDIKELVIVKSSTLQINEEITQQHNVKVVNLSDFKAKEYVNINPEIEYTLFTDDRTLHYKNSIWGMCVAFEYSDSDAISRSTYYKVSKLCDKFDYSIENPNWYVPMKEVSTSCCLIKDKNFTNLIVNLHDKKIKSTSDVKNILLVDPFNAVQIDDATKLNSKEKLIDFIYKTSPYLGI
ncbi:Uncharacterized protein conserved in bacteria [Neisseria animaloris]|uniref:CgeB family protein n=3 Tax=Neisseria animaloris TaxID=326522 RepID=UPI000F71201B|nr:glycosyltransferase [Neisseria animaloris]VEH87505.1 Uncharacterized protein conserved in bacteria [Neisseria animaloris]